MASLFQTSPDAWKAVHLRFDHAIISCCKNRIIPEEMQWHHQDANKPQIPADAIEDYTNFAFGNLPYALSARPVFVTRGCFACCTGIRQEFTIAHDPMGAPVGSVVVEYPCLDNFWPVWKMGCTPATVTVTGPAQDTIVGEYKRALCYGSCRNEETIKFNTDTQPEMRWRTVGPWEGFLFSWCCTISKIGWQGRSLEDGAVDPNNALADQWVAYDASVRMSQCNNIKLMCTQINAGMGFCCADNDFVPRSIRPDDIRRLVSTRYDWVLSRRFIKEIDDFDYVDYSLKEGSPLRIMYPLMPAEDTTAVYSARLYHTTKCIAPDIKWATTPDVRPFYDQASCDVKYRGSRTPNGAPTLSEHLIVLGGLIMNGIATFPATEVPDWLKCLFCMRARNIGGAQEMRGVLVPRDTPVKTS